MSVARSLGSIPPSGREILNAGPAILGLGLSFNADVSERERNLRVAGLGVIEERAGWCSSGDCGKNGLIFPMAGS